MRRLILPAIALSFAAGVSLSAVTQTDLFGPLDLFSWTTGGRPSAPIAGAIGFNSSLNGVDVYTGSAWVTLNQNVSNSDGSLTISPTTGPSVIALNLAHGNVWSVNQQFSTIGVTGLAGVGSLSANTTIFATGIISTTGGIANAGVYAYSSTSAVFPTTGFSNTIPDNCERYLMAPAGTLATGTLTMPANPVNLQTVTIMTTATIVSFTLNANTGQTILNAPSATAFNSGLAIKYFFDGTTWYREQ